MELNDVGKLPRWSPTLNRDFSAHWFSESASEDGIFHAFILPPTNSSLAAEKPKRKNRSSTEAEAVLEQPAMVLLLIAECVLCVKGIPLLLYKHKGVDLHWWGWTNYCIMYL